MNASRFPGISPALILLADNIIHSDDCSYEPPDLEADDPGVDCDCYVEKFYGFLSDELTRLERIPAESKRIGASRDLFLSRLNIAETALSNSHLFDHLGNHQVEACEACAYFSRFNPYAASAAAND
jgi:hypothetical protein